MFRKSPYSTLAIAFAGVMMCLASGCEPPHLVGDAEPVTEGASSPPDETLAADGVGATQAAPSTTAKPNLPPEWHVNEWAWNDVPGNVCGYGQQTGFGVNVGTGSDVLIYMEGGGACFDEVTCAVGIKGVGLAGNFQTGYTATTFHGNPPRGGIFDRDRANNPYKNSTLVYIPYCTGDFHSGSATRWFVTQQKTAHWAGRTNFEHDLEKFAPLFQNASRVTLAGSSAGGFGAMFNFERVHEAFANIRVDLVADSAPLLWNQALAFSGMATWNAFDTLPADCPECKSNFRSFYRYYSTKYPQSRIAFTEFDQDNVMSAAFTLLPMPQFYQAIHDLTVKTLKPLPNVEYFDAAGGNHTMLYALDTTSQPSCCDWVLGACVPKTCGTAMTIGDWLTKMYTDDPTWKQQTSLHE
jgi:hypothetical protein